jgi:hypothetical protein
MKRRSRREEAARMVLALGGLVLSGSLASGQTPIWEVQPEPKLFSFGDSISPVDDVDGDISRCPHSRGHPAALSGVRARGRILQLARGVSRSPALPLAARRESPTEPRGGWTMRMSVR